MVLLVHEKCPLYNSNSSVNLLSFAVSQRFALDKMQKMVDVSCGHKYHSNTLKLIPPLSWQVKYFSGEIVSRIFILKNTVVIKQFNLDRTVLKCTTNIHVHLGVLYTILEE